MQLKEIKIKGFKSFANKIKLNITPGITVIVGPNGCGKSNITDAVRWILGEQNIRSLRGSNLTDMIFSGNSEQKMRNIAEVSILFDNVDRKLSIDSEEVELKRIIYRSGETENYINGISCKLRDIHELFWGTGLGKNSYSIIAQGKVDFVLNAKPSERRILFEEASNISSYKNKKDAAIKKLEHTQDNLLRVNDILSEVKENLLHYQNKADDLKAYQFYRDNIRKLELYLLSQQYLLYQKNTKKFADKLSTLKEEIIKIEKIIITNKEEIHQKEQRKIHFEKQLNDSENHFQQSEKEKIDISNQLIVLQQKIKEISQRTVNLHEDIEDAKKQFVKFKDTLANIDKSIQETNQKSNLAKERYQRNDIFLQKYHVLFTYYEGRISNIEENSRRLNKRYLIQYREKRIKEETLLKSSKMSLDDINREKKIINSKINTNCKEIQNTEEKKIFYEKKIKQLKEERRRTEKLLADSKLFINTETKKVQNYSNDILLKNKEKDFLDELIKNQQDININIKKELLEKNLENIYLLEGIHDIVNEVPDSLKKLISFLLKDKVPLIRIAHLDKIPIIIDKNLQKNSIGQIKVISEDIISKENFQKRTKELKYIMDKDSVLGFANQLISYPPEYKKILEVLLRNILVVRNMETAFQLVVKLKEQWVIASLDGVIIDINGIITLNYFSEDRRYSEHIPRERIKKLEQEIKYIDAEKKKIQEKLNLRKNDNQKLSGKYEQIERQLEDYTSGLHKQDNYLFEINRKITDLKNQLTSLNNKERVEEEKRKGLEKNISIFRLRIRQIEEHLKS
ncbi:MAG: AAA family ATPase, partial [Atribacterota bacterium]